MDHRCAWRNVWTKWGARERGCSGHAEEARPGDGGDGAAYDSRWEWVIGAGNGEGQHDERYRWHNVAAALGVFIYSCLPNCIVVETMTALKADVPRKRMEQCVDASFVFYVLIYLVTGLPAVLGWGGDIPIPISTSMRNDAAGGLAKAILIYSTMLDFVLASVTVNRFLVSRYIDPGYFASSSSSSSSSSVKWAGYSLPSLLLATLMALLIPRLESLTGILNSITGTTLQVTAVVLCLYMAPRGADIVTGNDYYEEEEEEEDEDDGEAPGAGESATSAAVEKQAAAKARLRGCYLAFGAYGVALTALIFAEAIYSIVELTDYSGDFWCEVVGRRR